MKVKYNAALHRLERPDGRPVATFELDISATLAFKIADRISQADKQPPRHITRNHRFCADPNN